MKTVKAKAGDLKKIGDALVQKRTPGGDLTVYRRSASDLDVTDEEFTDAMSKVVRYQQQRRDKILTGNQSFSNNNGDEHVINTLNGVNIYGIVSLPEYARKKNASFHLGCDTFTNDLLLQVTGAFHSGPPPVLDSEKFRKVQLIGVTNGNVINDMGRRGIEAREYGTDGRNIFDTYMNSDDDNSDGDY